MLSLEQVRRLKEVLKATSAPLAYESFSGFAEAVLSPLIELVGGHGGNLFITDVSASEKPLFLWHSYDRQLVQDYQARFFQESPIHRMIPRGIRVGQIGEVVDYELFEKTAFYNEFLAPRRIHHMATLLARLPVRGPKAGSLGVLGLHRAPGKEAFSKEDLEVLDLLTNPIEGALQTLLLAGSERQHLEQAFDSMEVGLLVLDWRLERVYANPALGLILNRRELTGPELAAIGELARRTRDRFVSRAGDEPEHEEPLRIQRVGRAFRIRVTVLPEGLMSARPHLLCVFVDARGASLKSSNVQAQFGLTDRELEVVGHCLMGLTNAQIANEMKIGAETVKHHLKNVFEKTGASRRSQLSALLALDPLGPLGPLRPPGRTGRNP